MTGGGIEANNNQYNYAFSNSHSRNRSLVPHSFDGHGLGNGLEHQQPLNGNRMLLANRNKLRTNAIKIDDITFGTNSVADKTTNAMSLIQSQLSENTPLDLSSKVHSNKMMKPHLKKQTAGSSAAINKNEYIPSILDSQIYFRNAASPVELVGPVISKQYDIKKRT